MEHKVLFKTPHGSVLYGLNHADSDEDFYTVVDKVKTKRACYAHQSIVGGVDHMVVDLGTWMSMLSREVPQAWEAAMSNMALVDEISHLRSGLRMTSTANGRYLRTITSFTLTQDPKSKRHGLRLALNMYDFNHTGRFNPTLTPNEADWVTEEAKKDCDVVYAKAMNIALDQLPPHLLR